jgi:hypothetical protein
MKKTTILFAMTTLCLSINILSAKRIVYIYKDGGGIFGYRTIDQDFLGFDQSGNSYYSLTCLRPGFARCKLQYAPYRVGGGTPDPLDEIGANILYNNAESLMEEADREIERGKDRGTINKKFQFTFENRNYWSHVNIKWHKKENGEVEYTLSSFETPAQN